MTTEPYFEKLVALLEGIGFDNKQLFNALECCSLEQFSQIGKSLNVFEFINIGIVDDIEDYDYGEAYGSYSVKPPCEEIDDTLARYPEEGSKEEPKWVRISEIIVPDEYSKEQLLLALKYVHDIRTLDTDILAVNTLAHTYLVPDKITVNPYHNFK